MPKPLEIVDIAAFRRVAKPGHLPPAVRFAVTGDAIATNDARTFSFVLSDESVDRYGDVIYARGWDLKNFANNPIALFGHDASSVENVIGKWVNVRVAGNQLLGDLEFLPEGVNPNADAVCKMVGAGYLKTVSVGFAPIAWKQTKDKSRPAGAVDFEKCELLECSVVPIPANPNALVQAKALGLTVKWLRIRNGAIFDPADEPKEAVKLRGLAKGYRKRGLYELASLCDLINYADYICSCVEREADDEGDGSPLPARMRAWVDEGNRIIAAMAEEETSENIQGTQDPDADAIGDTVEMAVGRALAAAGLAKSGKAISASNEKMLRAAHEHVKSAADMISSVVDPEQDDDGDVMDADEDEETKAAAIAARRANAAARKAALLS